MTHERRWSGRLKIRHDAVIDVQVLCLEGSLDRQTLPEARDAIRGVHARDAPLVLDLRLLREVETPCVELLVSVVRRAADGDARAAVVPPEDLEAWRALSAAGVESAATVSRSVGEAIHAVRPAAGRGDWTPSASVPIG